MEGGKGDGGEVEHIQQCRGCVSSGGAKEVEKGGGVAYESHSAFLFVVKGFDESFFPSHTYIQEPLHNKTYILFLYIFVVGGDVTEEGGEGRDGHTLS